MFMHNGFIGSWNRLRRRIEGMIPDALYPSRKGTTDSEAIFLAIMGSGLDADAAGATRRVINILRSLINESGYSEHLRFTAALSNGTDLYAFRFAENDTANTLYFREEHGHLVVVSEPLDARGLWKEVPPGHMLISSGSETQLAAFL
jgi:glutamine amidotransferase